MTYLSVVTTLYGSAAHLDEFYRRASAIASQVSPEYEIIFVNDGSPDQSLNMAVALHLTDPHVRVIDLSRNFGHHKAMMTGLMHARGSLVFLIDCDLEEEPELLPQFYQVLQSRGVDVVYGVQEFRKGNWFERVSGDVFYATFNFLSDYPLPRNLASIRLMTDRYVCALVAHQERELLIAGLWVITGFEQVPFPFQKRHRGSTSYTLSRRIATLTNFITSFTSKPLVFIFYMGAFISIVASLAAIYLIFHVMFLGAMLDGWPSLIISIWLLGGLILFSLGVIGIYLSKVFNEVKQRPYTIIREIYEQSHEK